MSQSRENLRADGRKVGQTLFYRILMVEAGGPIRDRKKQRYFKYIYIYIYIYIAECSLCSTLPLP